MTRTPNNFLTWLLLSGWLGSAAWAFWWFDGQYRQAFTESLAPFARFAQSPELPPELLAALRPENADSGVTLVHFRDPACPCTRFNTPHVEDIGDRYRREGLRLVTIDASDGAGPLARLAAWLPVPASPAALVVDADGRIAYFGPYSAGAGCVTGDGTFVERAIERALAGPSQAQMNLLSVGCYCAWPGAITASAQPNGVVWS